jgi:hypothetical protein
MPALGQEKGPQDKGKLQAQVSLSGILRLKIETRTEKTQARI